MPSSLKEYILNDLVDKLLIQLNKWIDCEWPRNTYVYGKKGEIYCRWTPSISRKGVTIQAKFTLANITIYEEFRGKGIFKNILKACCDTSVPVIRLECIQNPRLLVFARGSKYPGRKTIEIETVPPSIDWILE